MTTKFPIQIVKKNEQNKEFAAITSISIVTSASRSIRRELRFVEQDYTILVRSVCDTLNMTSKRKNSDPRLYWIAANAIDEFLGRINDIGFYLAKQNKTLARDIGLSESSIKKILAFRRRFPRISLVDPSISWVKYRTNRVQIPTQ